MQVELEKNKKKLKIPLGHILLWN